MQPYLSKNGLKTHSSSSKIKAIYFQFVSAKDHNSPIFYKLKNLIYLVCPWFQIKETKHLKYFKQNKLELVIERLVYHNSDFKHHGQLENQNLRIFVQEKRFFGQGNFSQFVK